MLHIPPRGNSVAENLSPQATREINCRVVRYVLEPRRLRVETARGVYGAETANTACEPNLRHSNASQVNAVRWREYVMNQPPYNRPARCTQAVAVR